MNNKKRNIKCSHCKRDPEVDPKNKNLWNGFFDGDTKQHVCWKCRDLHYSKKEIHTYTEFPVPLNFTAPFELPKKKKKVKQRD